MLSHAEIHVLKKQIETHSLRHHGNRRKLTSAMIHPTNMANAVIHHSPHQHHEILAVAEEMKLSLKLMEVLED